MMMNAKSQKAVSQQDKGEEEKRSGRKRAMDAVWWALNPPSINQEPKLGIWESFLETDGCRGYLTAMFIATSTIWVSLT